MEAVASPAARDPHQTKIALEAKQDGDLVAYERAVQALQNAEEDARVRGIAATATKNRLSLRPDLSRPLSRPGEHLYREPDALAQQRKEPSCYATRTSGTRSTRLVQHTEPLDC